MSLTKLERMLGFCLVILVGCGGSEEAAEHEAAATETELAPAPMAQAAAEMLGGGSLTPVHDGMAGSPHVQVAWNVEGANIAITYGRPFLKERTVGDSVEPLDGRVWRLGADEATTLTTDRDLMLGSAHVPAGEYTLWALTDGENTQLIVNSETGQWGTAYDESRDLARTDMTVSTLDTAADQLTLYVENSALRLEWGALAASVPIMVH
ncbi:uncharacterized protein METZ01_LOCUS93537 [marine metagenome]|uniref:DUF2911 domain-containing protein n=1 Tax=marine metagenome TaxID=408172 RepID=A0A381VMI9_9ZZZZ